MKFAEVSIIEQINIFGGPLKQGDIK